MEMEAGDGGEGQSTRSCWPSLANVVLLALSDCNLSNGKHTERA